jgi:hypothetical protein
MLTEREYLEQSQLALLLNAQFEALWRFADLVLWFKVGIARQQRLSLFQVLKSADLLL